MRWHEKGAERTARAAAAGHEVVNCHKWFCYFDFSQELEGDSHRYFGMGRVSLPFEKVYTFDPLAELPEESRAKVIGGQCNNWTEVTYNGKDLEWKLWPRGLAMAEVLWTYPDPQKRDFAEFKHRAAIHRDAMAARGVNAAPIK
jgi:hexosaminidase